MLLALASTGNRTTQAVDPINLLESNTSCFGHIAVWVSPLFDDVGQDVAKLARRPANHDLREATACSINVVSLIF
jgi:hypothetical protein